MSTSTGSCSGGRRWFEIGLPLWRGDLSPLGGEAAPNHAPQSVRQTAEPGFTTASQPNGDKSPRHSVMH
ncbi:hypothetical protein DBR24_29385 [Pseudomonas sp. HMWF006]|nr:hypothetical protein DBR24_29385 [Pseudomonas sp. HMWF006]